MTGAQAGLLLLTCPLGDGAAPLTAAQYASLCRRMRGLPPPEDGDRALTLDDLCAVGCEEALASRVLSLLERQPLLERAAAQWRAKGVSVCTRLDGDYPTALLRKLGDSAPAALFLLGDGALLHSDCISVVGSRTPEPESAAFAEKVGRFAAARGLTLVSGDARGVDRIAQSACLAAGGRVISFVCDSLQTRIPRSRLLYVSAEGPACHFSTERALARNHLIHAQGRAVIAIQPRDGCGGTWSGTNANLLHGWTPVYLLDNGTRAVRHLFRDGAHPITAEQLPLLPL